MHWCCALVHWCCAVLAVRGEASIIDRSLSYSSSSPPSSYTHPCHRSHHPRRPHLQQRVLHLSFTLSNYQPSSWQCPSQRNSKIGIKRCKTCEISVENRAKYENAVKKVETQFGSRLLAQTGKNKTKKNNCFSKSGNDDEA